jgi:hypothetical protein
MLQGGKDHRIFPLPDSNIIEVGDIGSLNLIDERRAKKLLLKKNTEFRVYYHHLSPQEDTADTFTSIGEGTTPPNDSQPNAPPNDPRLNQLLEEYQHIFRSTLPDELPPKRDIEHEIETGDATPINIRAYPLSSQQLKEQTKQIAEALEKGLIRESTSS